MSITATTRKNLWGKSGFRCSFPECQKELQVVSKDSKVKSITGEEAHIIAKSVKGPRREFFREGMDIDDYDNLILLCSSHHKLIDDKSASFSPETLHQFKQAHELWVHNSLSFDHAKLIDEEFYAFCIDKIVSFLDFNNYDSWNYKLRDPAFPKISKDQYNLCRAFIEFVVSRPWPGRYAELEDAILNLKNITNDLLDTFSSNMEEIFNIPDFWRFSRYYEDIRNEETRELKSSEHDAYIRLIHELAIEMTRASNYFLKMIRKHFDPRFRLEEGNIVITLGPFEDMSFIRYCFEYQQENEDNFLYQGIEKFRSDINI